jgi:hypothetical protein
MSEWQLGPSDRPGGEPPPAVRPVPYGGFNTPPQASGQFADPLISPDYNGWWSRGVAIVRRGWRPLLSLQAVGVIVALVTQAPLAAYTALASNDLIAATGPAGPGTPPDATPLFGLLGFGVLGALLGIVVGAMVTLASVHIGVSVAVGAEARFRDALRLAARRLLPLIGWYLLAAPIYLIAVCLCVLPVVYVAAALTVLPAVVAVERTNAIGRSFALFHGRLGPAVARTATILGLTFGVGLLVALVGQLIEVGVASAVPGSDGVVAGAFATTLLGALLGGALAVLTAPLTLTAYADLRARVEYVTTDRIAWELGIPTAAAPA